jgi:hypothetical protein
MSFDVKETAARIVDHLVRLVTDYGLELLQRYPNDLLVIDRVLLEAAAYPGAKIAWMVGHSHTHLFPLGIHPEKNQSVTWVTNFGNDDRFFVIDVRHGGLFSVKELDRKKFESLQHTPLLYSPEGNDQSSFWLLKHGRRIGFVSIELHGGMAERAAKVNITPVAGLGEQDRHVLELWGDIAASRTAHSLFTPRQTVWNAPVVLAQKAAA